jgi:hypothetical protein
VKVPVTRCRFGGKREAEQSDLAQDVKTKVMTAFILTWKEDIWPYEELRKLLDTYKRDGAVETIWRVGANRQAKPGHLAFSEARR